MPALEGMGFAYLNLDRFKDAANALRQAISIKPDAPCTHAWLAQAYAGLHDEEAARKEVATLLQLDAAMAKEIEPSINEKLKAPLPNNL
jgi:Tfp pilus assembly protein PilF